MSPILFLFEHFGPSDKIRQRTAPVQQHTRTLNQPSSGLLTAHAT